MKISRMHILVIMAAIMTAFVSCKKDEAEVIPRKKLARIYADMLVTDQWITSTPGIRRIADTSLVYEPILEKYGYDSEDYRVSIAKYMDDPERFAKIFKGTAEILGERIVELEREQERLKRLAELPKIIYDYKLEEMSPYYKNEPYVHYYDSLSVYFDSTLSYRIVSVDKGDTLYDGPRIIVKSRDSLKVDSLKVDSLKVDSLKVDSLKVDSLKMDVMKIDTLKMDRKKIERPLFDPDKRRVLK